MMRSIHAAWNYRNFILSCVAREFKIRYQGSVLGSLWALINPLAMVVVYTLVFSEVMRARLPGDPSNYGYSVFLCSGVLCWSFFSELITRSQTTFLENSNLIKKINFPRICLPIIVLISATLNFLISWGLFTLFLLMIGRFPGPEFIWILPLLLVIIALGMGMGITLGVLNVFFRDIAQFFGIFMQFWFWLTPIVYPVAAVPKKYVELLSLNPIAALMGSIQNVVTSGQQPVWSSLIPIVCVAICFCFFGLYLFRRRSSEVLDEL
jgi:lipopolysaccharide transport system permease protein